MAVPDGQEPIAAAGKANTTTFYLGREGSEASKINYDIGI